MESNQPQEQKIYFAKKGFDSIQYLYLLDPNGGYYLSNYGLTEDETRRTEFGLNDERPYFPMGTWITYKGVPSPYSVELKKPGSVSLWSKIKNLFKKS